MEWMCDSMSDAKRGAHTKTRSASHTSSPAAVTEAGRRGGSPNWAFFSRSVGAASSSSSSSATLRKNEPLRCREREMLRTKEQESHRVYVIVILAHVTGRYVHADQCMSRVSECARVSRRELAECMI